MIKNEAELTQALVEINRRLLKKEPPAGIIETVESRWFRHVFGWPTRASLRLYGRVASIARKRFIADRSEKNRKAFFHSFTALGFEADALYNDNQSSKAFSISLLYLKIVLNAAKLHSPQLSEQIVVQICDDIKRAAEGGIIAHSITTNISEPWRARGWAYKYAPSLSRLIDFADVAPPSQRDELLLTTLLIAEKSLDALQKLRDRPLFPDTYRLLYERTDHEFDDKTLHQFVIDRVTGAMERIAEMAKQPDKVPSAIAEIAAGHSLTAASLSQSTVEGGIPPLPPFTPH